MKKRIFCSLLAVMLLASMLVVGISAAEGKTLTACGPVGFKDADRVTYTEAVAVTGGIGLFAGTTDGRFAPLSSVNRAQMATIVVKMLKGADFNADSYKGESNPFPDTAAFEGGWAEGYINACVQLGIVKGYGDGTFQPGNSVTAAEALTMVLNALKIDAGAGEWPATVMNKATELKLTDGLNAAPEADKVLNREQLAVLVYAGIQHKPEGGETLLSSVFGVDKIDTEHKYGQTHCEVCRTVKPGLLTRADLEQAVVETAWAYFMKGVKLQYCSQVLDKVGKTFDGHYRTDEDAAPEFGTADHTMYAVCSDYTNKAWFESVGHRLLNGDGPEDSFTDEMWLYCENQPDGFYKSGVIDPISENNVDFCLVRWMDLAHDPGSSWDYSVQIEKSPYFANFGDYKLTFANGYYPTTQEEHETQTAAVYEFLRDWEKNLRPGDVFGSDSHALLYVGNGYILDCTSKGGGKYDLEKGVDKIEATGAVFRLSDMEWLITNYVSDKASNDDWFVVFRPTAGLVVDDGDGILGNDLLIDQSYTIPEKTQTRLAYPGMEIDRTASIMPYNTAVSGDELTYSIKISNKSDNELYVKYHNYGSGVFEPVDYKALPVTETVPAGTQFVSATGEYKLENGKLTWALDVPAGQTVEVTYTVKVTAPIGTKLVNNGGFVGAIPSNSLDHTVGGKKLTADKNAVLLDIAATDTAQWREKYNVSALTNELDFAERLYQKIGVDLELPTLTELVTNVFPWKTSPWLSNFARLSNKGTIDTYMIENEPSAEYQKYRDMLVENYWGGYQFFTGAEAKGTTINELRAEYLEPGDIITYVTFTVKGEPLTSHVLVYAGKDANGEPALMSVDSVAKKFEVFHGQAARDRIWNAFMPNIDLFFVLRPSQVMEDVNTAAAFDAAKEPVYGEEPNVTRPTEVGTTSLPEATVRALQSLTYKDVFGNKINYVYNLYEKIGIRDMNTVMTNTSGKALASSSAGSSIVFKNVEGGSGVDRVYELRDEPLNAFGKMALEGIYGGAWLPEGGRAPTLDELQPGDILMMGGRALNSKGTAVADETYAVYQGDGKFLLGAYYGYARMTPNGNMPKSGYGYGQVDFSGDKPTGIMNLGASISALGSKYNRTINDLTQADENYGYVKIDSLEHLFNYDPVTGEKWKFAFVIRPTQGVYDICDLSYTPETPETPAN